MIDSERTGGGFSMVEPRTLGSPIHTHSCEDEYSYVLEGRVGPVIGDDVLEAISPASFERYFAEAESLLAPGEPDMEAFAALSQRYGLDMDFESVPRLAAQYGLEMPPEGELADTEL